MRTLGVGIVGAGGIARQHGIAWQANAPRAEVVAVADVSTTRATYLADTYSRDARTYDGLAAMLTDPNVDVVDICLPHHLHTEAIIASARAGKAILCEKPLCTSLEDARAIEAAVAESGVVFMMAHNQLFQPSLIEAKRLLAAGTLGRPFILRSIEVFQHRAMAAGQVPAHMRDGEDPWAWRADLSRMGGGEILDTGWHATYRLLALAGDDRPVEVTAMLDNYFVKALPAEDTGSIQVRFASGAIGQILTSWAFSTVDGWHFEVAAEHGAIAGSGNRLVHQLHRWPKPAEHPVEPAHSFTGEVTHFLDVVQNGAPNQATLRHGARVLQLTKAAYRAAEERRTILLPDDPTADPHPATEVLAAVS